MRTIDMHSKQPNISWVYPTPDNKLPPPFPLQVVTNAGFGSGNGVFLMDDLSCRGDESRVTDCDFAGWGRSDCTEAEVGSRSGGDRYGFGAGQTVPRQRWAGLHRAVGCASLRFLHFLCVFFSAS